MSHCVAVPDSGSAVLYSQADSSRWGWLYPDTNFTVRGLATPAS